MAADPTIAPADTDPWDERLDTLRAREILDRLSPSHRAALTLRYVDDLRERIVRALALPRGVTRVTQTDETPPDPGLSYQQGDVVHVSFQTPDVDRTRAFYAAVLGWTYLPDGRVDGSNPSVGFRPGPGLMTCDYAVTDLSAAVDEVRDAGGRPGEVEQFPWASVCECVDDQGVAFRLHEVPVSSGARPPVNGDRAGDLSYLTLHVDDSGRTRAFYGRVLGWTFAPGRVADGWAVQDSRPMAGLAGGQSRATAVSMWRVDDVDAAVARVRENGGTATDPAMQPYGRSSECVDDQGLPFYLGEA